MSELERRARSEEPRAVPLAAAWFDVFAAGDRSARELGHEIERRVR
jgi:hypothetical protein